MSFLSDLVRCYHVLNTFVGCFLTDVKFRIASRIISRYWFNTTNVDFWRHY